MDLKKNIPLLLCGVIIAVGMIVASSIFANATANRPMVGSFSGSLSSSNIYSNDIMDIYALIQYLRIYPEVGEDYDEAKLISDLQDSILSGDWPGFPYVQLDGRLYFSKQAVDDWFAEQGKQQLVVD